MTLDPELVAEIAALIAARQGRPEKPRETVRALWARWAAWVPGNRPDALVVAKHAKVILDLQFQLGSGTVCMGDQPWDAVGHLMIDAWRDKLTTMPDARYNDPAKAPRLSAGYRNRLVNTYQAFFTWCLERELVTRNPVSRIGKEDESGGERVAWWSDDEFDRHIPKAHPMLQDMLRVAFRCGGMRSGEVRGLSKTRSVDWEHRMITIRARDHKNRTSKTIPITDDCWFILLGRRDTTPGDLLFPDPRSPTGRPLAASTLQGWVRVWREAAGFTHLGENVVFHTARRSHGVCQMLKRANLPHTMDVMGITSMKVARGYMRAAGLALEDTREKMNERCSPKQAQPPPDRMRGRGGTE